MKRLNLEKRKHLIWLTSPQGRKYGSFEALRAFVHAKRDELRERLRLANLGPGDK